MKLIRKTRIIRSNNKSRRYGLFMCDVCGNESEKRIEHGIKQSSCGCLKHNNYGTRLHCIWAGILSRCRNKNRKSYQDYGKRGVSVCSDWLIFNNFMEWAVKNGYNDNLQIDRIDNDGNYEPSNCRFVTLEENCQNRRNTKLNKDLVKSIRKYKSYNNFNISQVADMFGLEKKCISDAINRRTWKNV